MKNLKEFVASWPQGITVSHKIAALGKEFSELTEDEKWQYVDHGWCLISQVEVSKKGSKWYMYHRIVEIKRKGLQFYPKSSVKMKMSIVDGKITVHDVMWRNIYDLHSRYEWVGQITSTRFGGSITNKTLLKEILLGNITNPESFYKWIIKHSYKGVDIPWKIFRKYADSRMGISIFDLIDATTHPAEALARLLEYEEKQCWQERNLLTDTIQSALRLKEKINPQWSFKRMQAEHQRQNEAINLKKIGALCNEPITHLLDGYDFPEGVKLLNTEREVYSEATYMKHCLHSCYYERMKKGRYIAFSIIIGEERITLGCTIGEAGFLMFDQCHSRYNGSSSDPMREFVSKLIKGINQHITNTQALESFDWNSFIANYELL